MTNFTKIIEKYRQYSSSVANQGYKFEKLIKNFLETYQLYKNLFENVWLWSDFPFKNDFGKHDVGIDIVAKTKNNKYWAVQCKCFEEDAYIQKEDVDSFLSTSARSFLDENNKKINFSYRLWVSTTDNWSRNAEESLKNQTPEVGKLSLTDLKEAEVDWEKLDNDFKSRQAELKKKEPREYQNKVIEATKKYFEEGNSRGKLIMACGTGKTFTSLKIAEMFAKEKLLKMFNPLSQYNDFKCLFLVPSIALIGQALREWATQAETPINPICICSDNEVSKQNVDEDVGPEELAFPASTDVKSIISQFELIEKTRKEGEMTVVFSTYQSIDIISKAQKKLNEKHNNKYNFDLIICDEAHRTAKATQKNKEESDFTKVHNNNFLVADKRIYMTATPIIYDEKIKSKAIENNFVDFVYSMDDEEYYGKEIYKIGFGDAVRNNLLTDYKVIVLTVNEDVISNDLIEDIIEDIEDGTEIKTIETDDIVKLVGCINALSKNLPYDEDMKIIDPGFMKKAVAFSNTIKISKQNTNILNSLQRKYYNKLSEEDKIKTVKIEAHHIDGSMTAGTREKELSWLKEEKADDYCKILLNAKCLSEGVDVPSLDAIMFLSDKSSQVDIVQSVGRVMRKAEGKKYGYIIVPVVIPYGEKPEDYLDKGDKFKTVWKVLNALRSHDEDFDIMVNSLRFSTNN